MYTKFSINPYRLPTTLSRTLLVATCFLSIIYALASSKRAATAVPLSATIRENNEAHYNVPAISKIMKSRTGHSNVTAETGIGFNTSLQINFQDSLTQTPVGWLADYGQPFGARTFSNRSTGRTYGWIRSSDQTPLDLRSYGRRRSTPSDTLLATLMHMQFAGAPESVWEAQVPNGNYDVTVSVGDGGFLDSKHSLTVEGVPAIANFIPTAAARFKKATVSVTVADGLLTVEPTGGTNTKINYVTIEPVTNPLPEKLIVFTQSSQSGEVEQGSAQDLLEYLSTSDNIPVSAQLNATDESGTVPSWLTVNGKTLVGINYTTGSEVTFTFDATNLSIGKYTAKVTASAPGYINATLDIHLTVKAGSAGMQASLQINFQDSLTRTPVGWLADYGQPFGARTFSNRSTGRTYGWIRSSDQTPLDLRSYGRRRSTPSDTLLATLMHMQFAGAPESVWEAQVPNGNYDVTVSVGDGGFLDSKHSLTVEGVPAIINFTATPAVYFKKATVSVTVADGLLTVEPTGGTNTKINYISIQPSTSRRPSVVQINPENGSQNVSDLTSVSTSILNLANGGIDNATLDTTSVYLEEESSGKKLPAHVNGTGGGDAITLVPENPLKLNTTYIFYITDKVKDLSGASFIPYASTFTTGSVATGKLTNVKFKKMRLPNTTGNHSTLTIGPDGKLYALSIDGVIKRFVINNDGTLKDPELIYSLQNAGGARQPRLAIGLVFDPSSTAGNLVAYVTHSSYVFLNAPDWDGKITRLSGANLQNVQDLVVHLPRSTKDHLTNSLTFGPDGALYITQGSNSGMGRADRTWGDREERLLSAAILRLDLKGLTSLPLDVLTPEGGGTYNPYAAGSPLTIFATGIRNAYDLVWHSNGELYVPSNGSAAGGNTPASIEGTIRPDGMTYHGSAVPALSNVQQTQKDFLFRVKEGGYYGHPNSVRGEYVMNGGNPSSSIDPAQVDAYTIGTPPDVNWRGYSFDFQMNKSPNGVIEYKSNSFGGLLKGKLLVVRYSQNDDIITLTPGGTNKDIVSYIEGGAIEGFSGFIDPLDLTEDTRNGNIYVSEYGGNGTITLLQSDMGSTTPAAKISVSPRVLYDNDVSGGAPGINRVVTVKNEADTNALFINSISLTGAHADHFIMGSLPAFPVTIPPKDSLSVTVAFNPTSSGLKTASLIISSNDVIHPSLHVQLRGLGTTGTSGSGEPSLQAILNLYSIPVSAGDDNAATTVIHSNSSMQKAALLGEEVSMQKFVKADTGFVTIEPLAVFGPTAGNPVLGMGWYTSGNSNSRNELFTVSNSPLSNGQTVRVNSTGAYSFNPGNIPFGFYTRWPAYGNRHIYSEDELNTFAGSIPHHVRVYPYKNESGIVPFTYVVAVEDNISGFDYQDLVFIVKNVKAVQTNEVNVSAIADASIRNGSFSNTNHGSDTTLLVRGTTSAGNSRMSYLKFPLNNLVDVVSAKLRLYGRNTESTGLTNVFVSGVENDNWTESGITWNNAPPAQTAIPETFGVNNEGRYYEVDVTTFVKSQFANDKIVTLMIWDTANQNRLLSFNSRENIRFQPQLVIKTSGSLPSSNALLFVENLDRFPSNDNFVASRIQTPWTRDNVVYNANHDVLQVRLHNKGMSPLIIQKLNLSNSANWKIVTLKGSTYNFETALPFTINSGAYADLQIKFTTFLSNASRIRTFFDELTIVSNDDKQPFKKIYLTGLWQREAEGSKEPTAQEIISAFGFKTSTGFSVADPDSGAHDKPKGDEIISSYFTRVDPTRPVTIRQIGAYHSCCQVADTLRWYRKGNLSSLATVGTHIVEDGQTLLPRRSLGASYLPAEGSFNPTTSFGFKVGDSDWTDTLLNPDRKIGIRVWKAIDRNGQVISNAYIIANDDLGLDYTNYDYNDNLYFVTNIRPESGPASASVLTSAPSAVDFGEKLLQSTSVFTLNLQSLGQVYSSGAQDPAINISTVNIVGENSSEFMVSPPVKSMLNAQETTTLNISFRPLSEGLKKADLLIYYNATASPLRVPLYGIAKTVGTIVTVPYRIKSGSTTDVTVNGKTYRSDSPYAFDNLQFSHNTKLTQVNATDEDELYIRELSSNADKKPFRYEIPIENGNYQVRLHFAETYWGVPGGNTGGGAGSRVMSVRMENVWKLINLDIAGEVGPASALVINIPVTVNDGQLDIVFAASVNRPTIGAIEVFQFKRGAYTVSSSGMQLSLREQPVAIDIEKPRVFPNPVQKQFTVEFPTTYRGTVNLQLTDIAGHVYELGQMQLRAGGVTLQVDVQRLNLSAGVYFLRVLSEGNKTETIKLLIQ